jgi:Resolvase, N terminal domain
VTQQELKPAARFIRVSGDTQDERSQVNDCDRAAGREGYTFVRPDFQLHAVSGSKGVKKHLDALDEALAAIRSGRVRRSGV